MVEQYGKFIGKSNNICKSLGARQQYSQTRLRSPMSEGGGGGTLVLLIITLFMNCKF